MSTICQSSQRVPPSRSLKKIIVSPIDEHRMIIDRFQDAFVATTLTEEQQKFMITPEVAALKRTRYSYDLQGEVVEYTEGIYNTALHPYDRV